VVPITCLKFAIDYNNNYEYTINITTALSLSVPGGNIAAAWAAMKALGEEGYMTKARELMLVTDKIKARIRSIQVSCVSMFVNKMPALNALK